MPFKIVQTTERGANKLFIVPSGWENQGQVRYPKKTNESASVKNDKSKPRADWPVMRCKVKRTGFLTYADADEELTIMLQHSDTDTGIAIGEAQRQTQFTIPVPDYNNMADLIYHSQPNTSNVSQIQQLVEEEVGDTYWIIGDSNEIPENAEPAIPPQPIIPPQPVIPPQPIIPPQPVIPPQPDTQKLNTIIKNQNKIMDMQNKFSYRLSNFIIEIETTIEKAITRTISRHLDQSVVYLGDARSATENSSFKLKPVDSINDLENLELLLLDPVEKNKLMKLYSVVCTTAEGHGVTCAYKLIDLLFTREFLCKCSWSGGSRGSTIKLPLKKYKNILDFCFKLIFSWDKSYTIEDNENFFKLVLRNAEQRKNFKNMRKPSKRNRVSKKQTGKVKNAKIVETNAIVTKNAGNKTKYGTSMRAESEVETVKEIDMEEEVEEETVYKDRMEGEMEEETTNETDVEEETTNEIDAEEATNETGVEEETTNETDMEEETTNETDIEEETTNETDMEKETTNKSDIEEETTNETDMEKETTNKSDIEEETTNETDMEKETTNKSDMVEVAGERVEEKDDNVMEKDSTDVSENVDKNIVKEVQLTEEVEKNLEKEMKMRSYLEKEEDCLSYMEKEKKKVKEMNTKEVEKEKIGQKATKENNKDEKENSKREFKQKQNAGILKKINKIYVKKESSRCLPKKQKQMVAKKIKDLHPSSQMKPQNQQSITATKKDLDDERKFILASPKRQNLTAVKKKKSLDHNGQSDQTPPKRLKPNATITSKDKT